MEARAGLSVPTEQSLHSMRPLWYVSMTSFCASPQAPDHYPVAQLPPNVSWKQLRNLLVKN